MTIQVQITGQIDVDDVTAEVLNYMTSFNMAAEFVSHFSGKYSPDELRQSLNKIHCQTAEVIKARKRALAAMDHVT